MYIYIYICIFVCTCIVRDTRHKDTPAGFAEERAIFAHEPRCLIGAPRTVAKDFLDHTLLAAIVKTDYATFRNI